MPCFRPIKGYRSRFVNPETGKRSIVFKPREAYLDMPIDIPCGQCRACRLERSRQWAMRCAHEAQLHEQNCFITLTYNNANLPSDGSLNKKHFQDFMKRLRFRIGKVRYFHCGEYGEKFARPHYHACLFGYDFPDKVLFRPGKFPGTRLYTSEVLEDLWENKGFCTIGEVTFESSAYVARYCTKKITGKRAEGHYGGRLPEYVTMSLKPGIGADWFERYRGDVYPKDFVTIRGKKFRPPKFYDRLFDVEDPDEFAKIKARRVAAAKKLSEDFSDRLAVREELQERRFEKLKRSYEDGSSDV